MKTTLYSLALLLWGSLFVEEVAHFAVAQEANVQTAGVSPGAVPGGPAGPPLGENTTGTAGGISLVLSSLLGLLVILDRFNLLPGRGANATPAPGAGVGHPPGTPTASDKLADAVAQIGARLGQLENDTKNLQDTVAQMDQRDRHDATILARMDERLQAWDKRFAKFEDALTLRRQA